MVEACENLQEGPQQGRGELASSSFLQPTGSQEIEQIKSGTSVEDEIQTLELEEHKVDLEEQQEGQKKKSLTSSFKKRFRYSLR